MTLQNSTCEIPHPIWAPAILQDWWAPPSYITPTRQKLFSSLSKIPLPLKLAGPSKKWEGKIPQRSSLLSSLLILSWVAPDPPCDWPMNFFDFIYSSAPVSFSFSSRVQPSTGALTNRKTEPTDEFIMGGKGKNKNKKLKEELLACSHPNGNQVKPRVRNHLDACQASPPETLSSLFFVYQKRRFPSSYSFSFRRLQLHPPPKSCFLLLFSFSLLLFWVCVFRSKEIKHTHRE